jgi:hypothetical protein
LKKSSPIHKIPFRSPDFRVQYNEFHARYGSDERRPALKAPSSPRPRRAGCAEKNEFTAELSDAGFNWRW